MHTEPAVLRAHRSAEPVTGKQRVFGARRVPPRQCSLRYVINLGVRIGAQFRLIARQLHSLRLPVERCRLAELRAAAFGKVNTLTA